MKDREANDLRSRILDEMTVDYASALEKNFNLAKQFIRVTTDGRVEVLVKERVPQKEQILLYLVGKLYAREAGLAASAQVSNAELMEELGMPKGSVLPALKELRDANRIERSKSGRTVYHSVAVSMVERAVRMVEDRLTKGG